MMVPSINFDTLEKECSFKYFDMRISGELMVEVASHFLVDDKGNKLFSRQEVNEIQKTLEEKGLRWRLPSATELMLFISSIQQILRDGRGLTGSEVLEALGLGFEGNGYIQANGLIRTRVDAKATTLWAADDGFVVLSEKGIDFFAHDIVHEPVSREYCRDRDGGYDPFEDPLPPYDDGFCCLLVSVT